MFSGLNLGLMSLTVEDLNIIIASSDNAQQIQFAKTILPLRRRGNLLLCTLLIGNTLVNVSLAVLTDPIWTYLFGTSTVGAVLSLALPSVIIVVLGEIVPQSVCSRHALSIGLSPPLPLPLACACALSLFEGAYARSHSRAWALCASRPLCARCPVPPHVRTSPRTRTRRPPKTDPPGSGVCAAQRSTDRAAATRAE